MPKRNVRVTIPQDPTAALDLLAKVRAKHEELAATPGGSPLAGLKWEKSINPALAAAKPQDDLAVDLAAKAEKAFRERDKNMPAVMQGLRDARDVLLGLNSDNPKALGDFHFEVNDTPQAKPAKKAPPAGA